MTPSQPHPSDLPEHNLEALLLWRAPRLSEIPGHGRIGEAALAFARAILEAAPDSCDRIYALQLVRLAALMASEAIARAPRPDSRLDIPAAEEGPP